MLEPAVKNALAFIDRQNLFHQVKDAFGLTLPPQNVSLSKLL